MLKFLHYNSSFEAKISLVTFCIKTHFWRLKSAKIYSLMTKMQKSAGNQSKKTFLHFPALWPKKLFTLYVCYLEGISTMWATPYVIKSLNLRNTEMFQPILGPTHIAKCKKKWKWGLLGPIEDFSHLPWVCGRACRQHTRSQRQPNSQLV